MNQSQLMNEHTKKNELQISLSEKNKEINFPPKKVIES